MTAQSLCVPNSCYRAIVPSKLLFILGFLIIGYFFYPLLEFCQEKVYKPSKKDNFSYYVVPVDCFLQ